MRVPLYFLLTDYPVKMRTMLAAAPFRWTDPATCGALLVCFLLGANVWRRCATCIEKTGSRRPPDREGRVGSEQRSSGFERVYREAAAKAMSILGRLILAFHAETYFRVGGV